MFPGRPSGWYSHDLHRHGDRRSDANTDSNRIADADSIADAHTDADAHTHANAYTHANADSNPIPIPNTRAV